jgi:murein DD-endopeptidase MepM/ murein hydrolase activator NlpD
MRRSAGVFSSLVLLGALSIVARGVTANPLPAEIPVGPRVEDLVLSGEAPDVAIASNVATRIPRPPTLYFPMNPSPRCDVLDNFGDARSGGRRHQGADILATLDQEVLAITDGVLTGQVIDGSGSSGSSLSGNAWTLTNPDRTYFFYAHLSRFAEGLSVGSSVRAGQVIGYIGDTGNPGPGNYHLHFEIHPQGGAAVNPLLSLQIPPGCRVY